MSKIGVSLKIDVTKLDKSRFFEGKNGAKYADLTVFIDPDNPDQYGQHGGIQIAKTKDEGNDVKLPYVGNCKVFWQEGAQKQGGWSQNESQKPQQSGGDNWDDDIPF